MIIGVTGYGVVGRATAEVLRRLGHTVNVGDTNPRRLEAASAEGFGCLGPNTKVQVLFLCVPEANLREALAACPASPITVIRSTVPPGTTDELSEEFGRVLVYMPEILREATNLWDAMDPAFLVIGCRSQKQGETLARLFAPLLAPVVTVSPSTAEMVKLALNAYLHTLVSFWNEIHLICNLAGVQSHVVGKLCNQDPRVSSYGAILHGKPVGGRCLPKDLAQLLAFAEGGGHRPELLRAVQRLNHLMEHGEGTAEDGYQPSELLPLRIQRSPVTIHSNGRA